MYTYKPLPPKATVRDPNFVTPKEAEAVAKAIMASPGGPTSIEGVEAVPPVDNIYPDGRVYILLNFSLVMNLQNSVGRMQDFTVPFSIVAGLVIEDISTVASKKFRFTATAGETVDTWIGDVELAG